MSCNTNSIKYPCPGYNNLGLPPCNPSTLFPKDCGHVPSFYSTLSLQILCPNSSVYFSTNPSLPTQDTKISSIYPGQIEIINTGYYDITFIVLVSGIGREIASCASTTLNGFCGFPTFGIMINNVRLQNATYSLSTFTGQLYGIGSFSFKKGDIVSLVNASLCPVSIGTTGTTINPTILNNLAGGRCGIGSSSASIQLTYRGSPSDINITTTS